MVLIHGALCPFAQAAATASLAKNNVEYRKRRLAVVLADSRVANKPKCVLRHCFGPTYSRLLS